MIRNSRRLSLLAAIFIFYAGAASAEWKNVARGVSYREFVENGMHAYVARIDLRQRSLRVIATDETEKGAVVSEFANRNGTVVAINADYFDETMRPVGHAKGAAGEWKERHGTRNQPVIGFAPRRAQIFRLESRESQLPEWVDHAVSGWPALIEKCRAFTASELPGSDSFTRAPHPRTAVGLSRDRRTLYLVVTDGRRPGVPGLTLAELGTFMRRELKACSALNLDGGGSSAIVLEGKVMNVPSDGAERVVSNHIGVVITPPHPSRTKQ